MRVTEHNAKIHSAKAGFFATLSSLFHSQGRGTPFHGLATTVARAAGPAARRAAGATGLLLLLATALTVTPAPARAESVGPPRVVEFKTTRNVQTGVEESTIHATRVNVVGTLEVNSSDTHWQLDYSTSKSGPWTAASSGTITPKSNPKTFGAELHHLTPKSTYFVRLLAENASGNITETIEFTTLPVSAPEILNPTAFQHFGEQVEETWCNSPFTITTTSIGCKTHIETNGAETAYRVEYATSELGPWTSVPGGLITVAEDFLKPSVHIEGLAPETTYYLRVAAENEKGETSKTTHIKTLSIKPEASFQSLPITNVTSTSAHAAGNVYPGTFETHWRFEYATSEGGPWTNGPEGVLSGPEADEEHHLPEADLTGLSPATVYFVRLFAENVNGTSTSSPRSFETAGPPVATTFAVHALHGEDMRALGSVEPHGLDTHYRFQYVSQAQFKESEWAKAASTPELDAGSGEFKAGIYPTKIVGQDIPGLQPGQTYTYRLLASNTQGTGEGKDRTLTVPTLAPEEESAACPNQATRTGASANLPDCRAYEQITPVDKRGSQEVFNYGLNFGQPGALVGEDGNHLMLAARFANWEPGPEGGQSPFFFSRTPAGWRMTAASPQPETGVSTLTPQIFDPSLAQFGFAADFQTAAEDTASPEVEFKAGAPAGPYTGVAVPRKQVGDEGAWVAASEDFSKLVLSVEDHKLVEPQTTTKSGSDLYEYSEGQLRQVNVGIGICGATIVKGREASGYASSRHAVSADGRRVFFEAVPGSNCEEPKHLYVRANGAETLDLGPYRFVAATAQGTKVLLEKRSGEAHEILLYETESASLKPLFSAQEDAATTLTVSEDLTAIYFNSAEQLISEAPPPIEKGTELGFFPTNIYRYDIPTETLRFVAQAAGHPGPSQVTPDGRYDYFEAPNTSTHGGAAHGVAGLPAGEGQVYRYDNAENLIQCMSCASPFNPEPKLLSAFGTYQDLGRARTQSGLPKVTLVSADGNFAFFNTPAALVPSDVDGEVEVDPKLKAEHASIEGNISPSSDVYEWRKDGINGCAHLQGCLALITNGRGGYLNLLLGSAEEGHDVFIYTSSQLLPSDNDTAGDIYDARSEGGIPPAPPRPVECEGDACSTPVPAPNDPTPSSSTFHGAGNEHPKAPGKHKHHKKHPKHHKAKKHHKRASNNHRRAGK